MKVDASLKYYRRSPKKILETAKLLKGKTVADAVLQLENTISGDSDDFIKLIRSAAANAENNFKLDKDNLLVEEIKVQKGPVLKRWRARAYGRAAQILKRTCHITVVLEEIEKGKKGKKKKDEVKADEVKTGSISETKKTEEIKEVKEDKTGKKREDIEITEKLAKDELLKKDKKTPKADWSKKIFRRKSV